MEQSRAKNLAEEGKELTRRNQQNAHRAKPIKAAKPDREENIPKWAGRGQLPTCDKVSRQHKMQEPAPKQDGPKRPVTGGKPEEPDLPAHRPKQQDGNYPETYTEKQHKPSQECQPQKEDTHVYPAWDDTDGQNGQAAETHHPVPKNLQTPSK